MRNLILATSLLLAAGTAFAQEATHVAPIPSTTPTTISENFFEIKDLVNTPSEGITSYYWSIENTYAGLTPENNVNTKHDGWYNLSSTLVRYDKEPFSYKAFNVDNHSMEWTLSVAVDGEGNVDMANSENLVGYRDVYDYYMAQDGDGNWGLTKGDFIRRVYYFSIPVSEEYWLKDADGNYLLTDDGYRIVRPDLPTPMTKIGVIVSDVMSTENNADPNLFYRADDQHYYLAFGTAEAGENGLYLRNGDPEIAFGQPLPAPVTTLLIALGFGAAFVMYRNRKQVKA